MTEHAPDGRRKPRPFRNHAVATLAVVLVLGMSVAVQAAAQATGIPHTGSLSVKKVVINNTGGPITLPPNFATTTHCSVNAATLGAHTPVAVPGNTTVTQTGQINAGIVCSVTEVVPAPIKSLEACKGRAATWTATYSPPVPIVTGQTAVLTVTNTLTCNPPTGGTLQIHKSVVNTLGVPTPPNFNMLATCSGMNPVPVAVAVNGTVTVPPAGQIAEGTVCTITETLPPQATGVKACPTGTASWVASNPGPLTVHTAQTTGTIITNTLTCDKPTTNTGTLKVIKSVANATGGPAAIPAAFAMTVSCTPSGPGNQAISVVPGPAGTTIPGIVAPSQCKVTEPPLPPIAHAEGCKGGSASWTTVISPAQPVSITAGGVTTVTVRNSLTCDKPTATNCANPTQTSIGCRLTVTVKRTKGQPIYSVLISPAATTPTPNIAPSTSSSCVIAGGAMINQTTCWFNYNTNPQPVTLTATSSAGALPAGFSWSGACSGTSATCTVTVTQTQLIALANFP